MGPFKIVAIAIVLLIQGCGDNTAVCPSGMVVEEGLCVPDTADGGRDVTTVDGGSDVFACDASLLRYADTDGDGAGDPAAPMMLCAETAGFVDDDSDCDDTLDSAKPGATELCDEIDNDCDGNFDEGLLALGEPVRVAFASEAATFIAAYPPGFIAAVRQFGDLLLTALGPSGNGLFIEWEIPQGMDWLSLQIVKEGTRALANYFPSVGGRAVIRVVSLDGTAVSETVPYGAVGSDTTGLRFTETGERLIATWVEFDGAVNTLQAAEFDPELPAFLGTPIVVHQFMEAGTGEFTRSVPLVVADGTELAIALSDRRDGDLVSQAYLLRVSLDPLEAVGEPQRVTMGELPAGNNALTRGFGDDAYSLFVATGARTTTYQRIGLDPSLAPSGDNSVAAPGLVATLGPERPDWLVHANADETNLLLPAAGAAEGQLLSLPGAIVAQRTSNSGGVVYINDEEDPTFMPIRCIP